MQPLWRKAAADLNLTAETADCTWISTFYGKQFDKVFDYSFPKASISYLPMWKVANTAIRCNLDEALKVAGDAPTPTSAASTTPNRVLFTMVREPLGRFVSGFSQINTADVHSKCPVFSPEPYESESMSSPERAETFIANLLEGKLYAGCWRFWHVYSQLGPLRYVDTTMWPTRRVGKLEEFETEWAYVQRKARVDFPKFDYKCGAHPDSSPESFPPRKAMEDAVSYSSRSDVQHSTGGHAASAVWSHFFAQHKTIRTALVCSVLLPDYVCFKYDLPDGPNTCVDAGFAESMKAWKATVKTISETMCPSLK